MRVLAVDPGLTRCGLGVIDGSVGKPIRLVHVDVLRTPPEAALEDRLFTMSTLLAAMIEQHQPEVVAIERVFSQSNVRTVMGTAQVSGLAMVAAVSLGCRVAHHTPSEVKAAVTGQGRADKAQVALMVTRLLRLDSAPKPADATDALALAICHVWRGGAASRLAAAQARQTRAVDQRAALGKPRSSAVVEEASR